MTLKSMKRGIGAVMIAAAIGTGMAAASGSASATTSDLNWLCTAVDDTPVHTAPSGSSPAPYTIARGDHMRVHAYSSDGVWFYGHGSGHSDGYAVVRHFVDAYGNLTCY